MRTIIDIVYEIAESHGNRYKDCIEDWMILREHEDGFATWKSKWDKTPVVPSNTKWSLDEVEALFHKRVLDSRSRKENS